MTTKTHVAAEFETGSHLTLKIELPGTKYIDKFIKRWKSAVDLMLTGYFPDSKEITESMGTLYFASKFAEFNNKEVTHFVLGDGVFPRTASMAAFITKWKNVSIDPVMKVERAEIKEHPLNGQTKVIENVRTIKCGCQDYKWDERDSGKIAVVSAVHCHASSGQIEDFISEIWHHFDSIYLIDMPCCISHKELNEIYGDPDEEFYDMNVFSPHRMFYGYTVKE